MASNEGASSLSNGKMAALMVFCLFLSGLIAFGLYKVTEKKEVAEPAHAIAESHEEIVLPVDVSLSDTDIEIGVGITKLIEAVGGGKKSRLYFPTVLSRALQPANVKLRRKMNSEEPHNAM